MKWFRSPTGYDAVNLDHVESVGKARSDERPDGGELLYGISFSTGRLRGTEFWYGSEEERNVAWTELMGV